MNSLMYLATSQYSEVSVESNHHWLVLGDVAELNGLVTKGEEGLMWDDNENVKN